MLEGWDCRADPGLVRSRGLVICQSLALGMLRVLAWLGDAADAGFWVMEQFPLREARRWGAWGVIYGNVFGAAV